MAFIAFDVGSTLIHPSMKALKELVGAEAAGVDLSNLARAFAYALEADQRALPDGDWAMRQGHELLRFLRPNEIPSTERARDLWHEVHRTGGSSSSLYTDIDPDAHIMLKILKSHGHQLVAASNSNGTLTDELAEFGLLEYFDYVIDSFDIGDEKPREGFFKYVLSLNTHQHATWYVGNDLVRDVVGALWGGFKRAVFYDRAHAYPGIATRYRIQRLVELLHIIRLEEGATVDTVD